MSFAPPRSRRLLAAALLAAPLTLGGCAMQVLSPAGDVARQEADLLLISTGLMLLVVVPVMILTALFAFRYRSSGEATYRPDWDHSTALELVIWAGPLLIIIAIGAITWIGTHTLDPYRPLARTGPGKMVDKAAKPLVVEVVALDWKWLFVYPEQGIATANILALPVGRPVQFRITASSVMNSFYIPALAGQIYAMPGMETKLHAVLNQPGSYTGLSANYSGAGFSGMHFQTYGMDEGAFERWAARVKAGGNALSRKAYLNLAKPSENVPALQWASVEPDLFDRITNMCVEAGRTCMADTMRRDMHGMGVVPATEGSQARPGSPSGALMRKNEDKGDSSRDKTLNAPAGASNSHS